MFRLPFYLNLTGFITENILLHTLRASQCGMNFSANSFSLVDLSVLVDF